MCKKPIKLHIRPRPISRKVMLSEIMGLLYDLEDRTGYKDDNLGKAINLLQDYKISDD